MVNKLGGLQDGSQWENKKSWGTYMPRMRNFELTATGFAKGLPSIATRPNSGTRHQLRVITSQTI